MTRHPRLFLVLYCLLCWLPGWAALPATDRDEARFAQATRQMAETGDVVTILNGDVPRNRKPIGIHWLQLPGVLAARAAGLATENPIWPYRLPSLLGALVAVLATHAAGRRLFDPRAALLGAALLGGSLLLTAEAHIAKTDAALLGATTVAMLVLARAYVSRDGGRDVGRGGAAVFWVALGAGILIKGPITPMVAGLTVATLALGDRRMGWLRALRPVSGVALLLLLVVPWFVAIGLATHGAFFRDSVGGDLAAKIAGGDDSHGGWPGYHLGLLMATLLPGGWAALAALPGAWRARAEPATRFLLAWAAPAWLMFEAVPTKLPHYVLPLLPPLCLLAARFLLAQERGRVAPALLAGVLRWTTIAGLTMASAAAIALPVRLGLPGWLGLPAVAGAWAMAAALTRGLVPALACAPLLYAGVFGVLLPGLTPVWLGPRLAAAIQAHGGAPGGVAVVGIQEPSIMFALGTATRWLGPQDAVGFLRGGPGRAVAVEGRREAAFAAALRDDLPPARHWGMLDGVDYSNGHRVTIAIYGRSE